MLGYDALGRQALGRSALAYGQLAANENADAASITGSVAWPVLTGILAVTEGADDATMAGSVAWPVISGPFAVIEAADDATMSGTVVWPVVTGTLVAAETADDATVAGTVEFPLVSGIFATTEAADDATNAGTVEWRATLVANEVADDATMAGAVEWPVISGTVAAIENADDATAAGSVTWLTALAASEAADDATMGGTVASVGAIAASETPDVFYAIGNVADPVHLRPSSDITLDGWTDQAGGISDIVQAINEVAANDADYVQAPSGTSADLSVRLFDGETQIAEWAHIDIADTFVNAEQILTEPQFDAITNFSNLIAELDDNHGNVYRFALSDPAMGVARPVKVRYRYKKLAA